MALDLWAFLYFSGDFSPELSRTETTNPAGDCTFITVGFDPATDEADILRVGGSFSTKGRKLSNCVVVSDRNGYQNMSSPRLVYSGWYRHIWSEFRQKLLEVDGISRQKLYSAGVVGNLVPVRFMGSSGTPCVLPSPI